MKRFSGLTLLILVSIFGCGFIKKHEPNIKGIICGSDTYMKVLKNNFSLEDIFTDKPQNKIKEEFESDYLNYFYSFFIDIKNGNMYKKDYSNEYVTYMVPITNYSDIKKNLMVVRRISLEELSSVNLNGAVSLTNYYIAPNKQAYFLSDNSGNKLLVKTNGSISPIDIIERLNEDIELISMNTGGIKYTKLNSEKKGNLIKISYFLISDLDFRLATDLKTLNLSKLYVAYTRNGEKVKDKCLYFPLSGIIEVKNKNP